MGSYKSHNSPRWKTRWLYILCGSLWLFLSSSIQTVSAGPIIKDRVVTNVRDDRFTVSWITDVAATGTINYGTTAALGTTVNDDRGAGTTSTTHYVTIMGLSASTLYYFDIVSGSTTDSNGGSHYTVTTGPTLSLSIPDGVYGQVFKSDGVTPATGTIVYINVIDNDSAGSPGPSAPMSALVDSFGYWNCNLGNARIVDLSGYFMYSASGGDNVRLVAKGGADGNTSPLLVDTSTDKPVSNLVLTLGPTAVRLSSLGAYSNDSSPIYLLMVGLAIGSIIVTTQPVAG